MVGMKTPLRAHLVVIVAYCLCYYTWQAKGEQGPFPSSSEPHSLMPWQHSTKQEGFAYHADLKLESLQARSPTLRTQGSWILTVCLTP